jgi:hypothetical protein
MLRLVMMETRMRMLSYIGLGQKKFSGVCIIFEACSAFFR